MIVLLGLILAVLASALFSGLETGLYTTSRLRLYLDAQAGVKAARAARRLLADMPTLLTVLLVANNLANWAASFLTQVALVRWDVRSPELVGTLVVSALLFVVAESAPKNAFRRAREGLLTRPCPCSWGPTACCACRPCRSPGSPGCCPARCAAGCGPGAGPPGSGRPCSGPGRRRAS